MTTALTPKQRKEMREIAREEVRLSEKVDEVYRVGIRCEDSLRVAHGKIDALAITQADHTGKLNALDDRMGSMEGRMESMEGRMIRIEDVLGRVASALNIDNTTPKQSDLPAASLRAQRSVRWALNRCAGVRYPAVQCSAV